MNCVLKGLNAAYIYSSSSFVGFSSAKGDGKKTQERIDVGGNSNGGVIRA